MANKARKTEHSGPKKGRGAYWGPKRDAKKENAKLRRRNNKEKILKALQSTRDQIWHERYADRMVSSR